MSEAARNSGQALKGRYVLRERLGAGGQGEVWRAFDPQTGVDIALKILQPASGRSAAAWVALVHEHEISARLDHPGILHVYPPERDAATFLLPMELAAGGDLRRLRGASYLTIVPVLLEVAKALEHAHERGIVHRDLKPGNVLFDARGRTKLADFGVAGRSSDSATGSMRGLSPFTASPEQLRGESPMPSDDVYGLGALAYELLSRNPPHYPHFDPQRMQHEPVPALVPAQQIPPQLAALVAAMLEKDPRKRPINMRDVIDELDASLNDTLTFDFETDEPPREGEPANRTAPPVEQATLPPHASELRAVPPVQVPAPPAAPAEAAQAAPAPAAPPRGVVDGEALWQQVSQVPLPRPAGIEPMRSGLPRALVVICILATIAVAAYYYLPRQQLPGSAAVAPAQTAGADGLQARFMTDHALLEQRITALDARGAAIWGGADFMTAKTRSAEASGAQATGNSDLARQRLDEASQLLNGVDEAAPGALAAELSAGDQALGAGQVALANQAYDLAVRIAPTDARALAGQARARELAAAAHPEAAAPAHTEAAFGQDQYAKAAGEGFAALGAGRLSEARAAFERARALRPDGAEAADGLKRVDAAEHSRGMGSLQTRAEDLEADERWDEALAAYTSALRQNPSAQFALEGKARAQARLDLSESLQGFIDRPDRLAAPQAREQAGAALKAAEAVSSPGPALRLQIARVAALLPEFEKTVRVSLVSDGLTQVSIPEIGSFGEFSRRDVDLKPGHYTVIGTREGYREVRRDVTVSPGQQAQVVNVTCYDPT